MIMGKSFYDKMAFKVLGHSVQTVHYRVNAQNARVDCSPYFAQKSSDIPLYQAVAQTSRTVHREVVKCFRIHPECKPCLLLELNESKKQRDGSSRSVFEKIALLGFMWIFMVVGHHCYGELTQTIMCNLWVRVAV